MQYIYCDSCKKLISGPKQGKNYYTLRHLHLCRPCMLTIKRDIQDKVEKEGEHYDFLQKKEEYWQTVDKKCAQ